ncbi:MAG: DUF2270 domain-containing protein [Ardenticatenaceae bacterium]
MAEPVGPPDSRGPDHIWSFRGYRLSPGEFNAAMVHFYRGEVTRSNTWRTRLDATTNWAVIATGAALSFAFSSPENPHIMIPINTLLVTLFLLIETRRYRYYELWAYRVRLMETDFFAAMLAPPFSPSETWATRLVDNLLHPAFTITFWEAFGRRFRRNYQFIFAILGAAWLFKILLHPNPAGSLEQFVSQAHLGTIPGSVVIVVGVLFNIALFAVGWLSTGLQESKGEVFHKEEVQSPLEIFRTASDVVAGHSLFPGRREEIAYIIAGRDNAKAIADRILTTMARGVTSIEGKGAYSGEAREILLVAIHPEQVVPLKRLVRDIDPKAFVIIHHAHEIVGEGFRASG